MVKKNCCRRIIWWLISNKGAKWHPARIPYEQRIGKKNKYVYASTIAIAMLILVVTDTVMYLLATIVLFENIPVQ